MFYPVESLRRGGRFYLCWVADSWPQRFDTINNRQIGAQDIRQICDDLLEVIVQESGRPSKRFSLRLTSQLIRGLVRLFHRKVNILIGDICMIQAHAMHSVNKRYRWVERVSTHETRTPQLPRLILEDDEESVEELLQNTRNAVAHIKDITLQEPTLPENRPLDDGFGELHLDQPILLLNDRTIEMMLGLEGSVNQQSALDLQLDLSPYKLADRSRVAPHASAHMDRVSDHDISLFNKSTGAELRAPADFDKEIPEIPDILLPEMPAPQEVPIEKDMDMPVEHPIENVPALVERPEQISLEEIAIEDLEAEQQTRKCKRAKLKIDQCTKLSSDYIRSRIQDDKVELRCKDSTSDIIQTTGVSCERLLRRPAHATARGGGPGLTVTRMFLRNLGYVVRRATPELVPEEVLAQNRRQQSTVLENIVEEMEPVGTAPPAVILEEPQDIARTVRESDISIHEPNISDYGNVGHPNVSVNMQPDISDWPTQKITEQTPREVPTPAKRQRRMGVVSYIASARPQMEIGDIGGALNKENIPDNQQTQEQRLTTLLQEAGLADIPQEKIIEIQKDLNANEVQSGKNGSETSETPLGSLDRTKVSLGDSEVTTDSRRFISDEWGTNGTMQKIYQCIKEGSGPITVGVLLSRGPTLPGHVRLIAAKCFGSLLKLKQHGFIVVSKNPVTLEIIDINYGPRLKFD